MEGRQGTVLQVGNCKSRLWEFVQRGVVGLAVALALTLE